jgi:hypothetical protein
MWAVQSTIVLADKNGASGQFLSTMSPSRLQDVDPAHLDRHLQLNHRLLGPVPYTGGDLQIELGLFSIGSSALTGPYLQLLGELADAATVTFFGAAAPFAEPLRRGIHALATSGDIAHLEIGLSATWARPRRGSIVVARAPRLDSTKFSIDARDGRLLDADDDAVTDFPYLVLDVSTSPTRDDWSAIPELTTAYGEVQREYRNGDVERTEQAMTAFRRIALTCRDLLFDDALLLVEKLDQRYEQMGPPTPVVRGGVSRALPPLAELSPYGDG